MTLPRHERHFARARLQKWSFYLLFCASKELCCCGNPNFITMHEELTWTTVHLSWIPEHVWGLSALSHSSPEGRGRQTDSTTTTRLRRTKQELVELASLSSHEWKPRARTKLLYFDIDKQGFSFLSWVLLLNCCVDCCCFTVAKNYRIPSSEKSGAPDKNTVISTENENGLFGFPGTQKWLLPHFWRTQTSAHPLQYAPCNVC